MSNLNNVSDDKFIFACMEHEKTSDAMSRAVYGDRMAIEGTDIKENIQKLVKHYASKVPHLTAKSEITIEELPELVPPVVGFSNDLMEIFESADEVLQPYVKGEEEADPHWKLIEDELTQNLDQISKHFLNYLHWYFGQQATSDHSQSASYQNNEGFNGDRNTNASKFDRSSNRDHNKGGSRGPRRGGGNRPPRKQLSPEEFQARREKQEQRAKTEVLAAIESLKNSEEREHSLRPSNSYHRRLQHQLISDSESGLYSYSVGEGRERFVVITKNENMSSSE